MKRANLTIRARSNEGVIFTGKSEAVDMVREAIYQRLSVEYNDFSRRDFIAFRHGRLNPSRAAQIINTYQNYIYCDPSVGKGIFLKILFDETTTWEGQYSQSVNPDWFARHVYGLDIDNNMIEYCSNNLKPRLLLKCGDFLNAQLPVPPDIIIANPPYIRQELLRQEYKNYILEAARREWPEIKISARTNLFQYFILKAAQILAPDGVMTFIAPNSWLDSDFGGSLRNLFTNKIQLLSMHESSKKRHFSADVNTLIFAARKKHPVLANTIELYQEKNKTVIAQQDLNQCNLSWYGTFFRCPDWLRNILGTSKAWLPIGRQIKVSTGIITGNNQYYYTKSKTTVDAIPAIRSPKDASGIEFRSDSARYWLKTKPAKFKIRRAPLLWVDLRGGRHLVVWNRDNLPFEHTFYGLTPLVDSSHREWALILNSTWIWLMIEIFGRKSLGGGAVRMVKTDLMKLPLPIFDKLPVSKLDDSILKRPILNWHHELDQPDRCELDLIVFRSLGLEQHYQECIQLLMDLMEQRESKSKR